VVGTDQPIEHLPQRQRQMLGVLIKDRTHLIEQAGLAEGKKEWS